MDNDPTHHEGESALEIPETWRRYSERATVISVGGPLPVAKKIDGRSRQVLQRCDVAKGARIIIPAAMFGTTLQGGTDEIRILTFDQIHDCAEITGDSQ